MTVDEARKVARTVLDDDTPGTVYNDLVRVLTTTSCACARKEPPMSDRHRKTRPRTRSTREAVRSPLSTDALDHAVSLYAAHEEGWARYPDDDATEPWRVALNVLRMRREARKALAYADAQRYPWDPDLAPTRATLDVRRARRAATEARWAKWRAGLGAWLSTHARTLSGREREVAEAWTRGESYMDTPARLGITLGSFLKLRNRVRGKLPTALRRQREPERRRRLPPVLRRPAPRRRSHSRRFSLASVTECKPSPRKDYNSAVSRSDKT